MKAIIPEQQLNCTTTKSSHPKVGSPLETSLLCPHHPPGQFGNKVLIVDDQPANLRLLRQLLAPKPYKLTFASSGRQALDRVKIAPPDLILLDLMMPGIDGLMVCQSLKQDLDTADIPIIFLTASHETEHLLQAFEYGAADYVTKPFRPAELLARVHAHLSLKEAQSDLHSLNQKLEQKIQQRTVALHQAYTFAKVSQRITHKIRSTIDESKICETVVRELTFTLELKRCQIGIYDEERSTSTITHDCVEKLPSNLGKINRFDDFGDIYPSLHQGQMIQAEITHDVQHGVPDTATFLACSLNDHQKIIGDIWLYRESLKAFSDDEIDLVQQIADQTAIALRQARLYQSSQAQVQELERLNYAKDDFLKTLSHELRTPLTAIKAAADTLHALFQQAEWSSLQSQQAVAQLFPILLDGYEREIKLVDTLLEFVHIDSQAKSVNSDAININELVTMITSSYKRHCQDRKQQFKLDSSPDLPLLLTDVDIFTRALYELLENAGKYTPAGETIELSISYEDHKFHFRVSNSGVEISEAELSQIFDKFYRLPQADRWQHGGLGLGLALAKKQVQYLGGVINATVVHETLTLDIELP